MIRVLLWEAFSLALFYSCFCRASFTHKGNTRRDVRWSFQLLGAVSIVCAVAPIWAYDDINGFALLLLGTIAIVQVTTAHHWRNGIPAAFRREP